MRVAYGWGLVDPGPAVDHRGELGEGAAVGAALGLLLDVDRQLPPVGRREVFDQAIDVSPVVPEVELLHPRVAGHPVPVGLPGGDHGLIRPGRLEAILPRRHHQAGGEAQQVPLEGPGEGLVEVAQVEHEVALWGGPEAKVEDVRVAAELDPQARCGAGTRDRRPSRQPRRGSSSRGRPPCARGEWAPVRGPGSGSGPGSSPVRRGRAPSRPNALARSAGPAGGRPVRSRVAPPGSPAGRAPGLGRERSWSGRYPS